MRGVLALLLLVTAAPCPALAAEGTPEPEALIEWRDWATAALDQPPADIQPLPAFSERLRELIAERRTEGTGLEPLERDDGLERAADAHAVDMLRRDFMAHESPEGLGPGARVALLARQFGGIVGENLAEHEGLDADQIEAQLGPLALKIADGFMASPGHRENILRPDYTHEAIGTFVQGERLVVVHMFGARSILLEQPVEFEQAGGSDLELRAAAGNDLVGYAYRAHGQPVEELVVLEPSSTEIVVDPGL
ncbi:MAG: CAP domain-containing protein, partial [Geminicoccaceae bacterium]|nr:CAP domain-containing protein [Geminicoccaceae bacterium]